MANTKDSTEANLIISACLLEGLKESKYVISKQLNDNQVNIESASAACRQLATTKLRPRNLLSDNNNTAQFYSQQSPFGIYAHQWKSPEASLCLLYDR